MKITFHLIAFAVISGLFAGCAMTPKKAADSRINLLQFVQQSPGGRITRDQYIDWNTTRLFNRYDQNGDGVIDHAEFQAIQGAGNGETFRQLDRDHNGKITLAEALADPRVRRAMGATFNDVDTDHNGTIDTKEAAAYVKKRQSLIP